LSGYRLDFTLLPRFRVCGWVNGTSPGEFCECKECLGGYRGGSKRISAWEYFLTNNCIFSFVDRLYTTSRSTTPIFIPAQRTRTRQVSRDRILFLNLQNTLNSLPSPPPPHLLARPIDLNAILQSSTILYYLDLYRHILYTHNLNELSDYLTSNIRPHVLVTIFELPPFFD
jgi:hypothetical protein